MAVAKEQIRQIISENNISSVADVYTLLKDSFKDILQELMEAELDATLGYEKNHKGDLQTDNKRNGHSTKNLKSQYGEFQIDVPRDRNGEFEPKLIPKYQRGISGIEEKVISLYARGMSTRDIHDQLQDLYGIELSAEMVSKITDKILPQVKEWQSRPLNPVYPFVFMDCIHYKVREDGRILSRAAYVVLGVTVEGYKDILSITVGANETSKFWLGMLNDLKNRGVKDVLFFCVDGLPGFKEAIQAVYPQAEIQRYILNHEGEARAKKIRDKIAGGLPAGLEIKVVNPQGILLLGRSRGLTKEQLFDFEIIKRQHKNIVDIMTYDDLLNRLKNILKQMEADSNCI